MNRKVNLAIVGVGKIVRDQHLPSIETNGEFHLAATASRNASVDGVRSFIDIETMLDQCELDAVSLCMPPQYRQAAAQLAIEHGKHVLLEKPPGATVSEVEQLAELASKKGVSLYATWHSRHGAAVEQAKSVLAERQLKSVQLNWKEDVRKWHPGQEWIWQAGGLGVFDPGINGLSILTHCLNAPAYVSQADLQFPANKAAPIAANLALKTASGIELTAEMDWRVDGGEAWTIDFETEQGLVQIIDGGAGLIVDGNSVEFDADSPYGEYEAIYARFAELIRTQQSDVDLKPLKLVADAFLLGNREVVSDFFD